MRILDRYVLRLWLQIFVLTGLGFPLVAITIDLVDHLNKWLDRGLTPSQIALSYFYALPENIFMVMPAAVLFASVFTVGTLGRSAEITAAKASGRSFHRLFRPIFVAGLGAALLNVVVGELAPGSSARSAEIQRGKDPRPQSARFNFVYRGDQGWVYTIRTLDVAANSLRQVVLERQGTGSEYPGLAVTADSATYDDSLRAWRLWHGTSRRIGEPGEEVVFRFTTMRLRALHQTPADLLAEPKSPEEMRYAELGRYIEALERSGNDANKLKVERALKLALPAACFVIALFGAPLAVTSPRSGAAVGIAFSLGTTIIYLTMIQISKAVGAGGVIDPTFAAWIPNLFFLACALVLLWRVRT